MFCGVGWGILCDRVYSMVFGIEIVVVIGGFWWEYRRYVGGRSCDGVFGGFGIKGRGVVLRLEDIC